MTSVDWATRLVNESEVNWRKRWPTTDQRTKSGEKLPSRKTVRYQIIQTAITYFGLFKLSAIFVF